MSCQESHRIDFDVAAPCKNCGKDTYTEYLCHPKYGNVHTDYHRYCPKCKSYKNTDDGELLFCPQCIAIYSEKYAVEQAQDHAERLKAEKLNENCAKVLVVSFILFILGLIGQGIYDEVMKQA
jgi:hypothetical protein